MTTHEITERILLVKTAQSIRISSWRKHHEDADTCLDQIRRCEAELKALERQLEHLNQTEDGNAEAPPLHAQRKESHP